MIISCGVFLVWDRYASFVYLDPLGKGAHKQEMAGKAVLAEGQAPVVARRSRDFEQKLAPLLCQPPVATVAETNCVSDKVQRAAKGSEFFGTTCSGC